MNASNVSRAVEIAVAVHDQPGLGTLSIRAIAEAVQHRFLLCCAGAGHKQDDSKDCRNVIVEFEVIEQRFGSGVLPHHDQQASVDKDHAVHGTNDSLYRALPAYQSDFFNTRGRYHSSGLVPATCEKDQIA